MQTKVAIVGAGLASLGATKTFLGANFEDFLILEATDRVGGRVNTIKLNESVLELGAQWLHDSDNYLYKLAEENNLISERFSEEGLGLYIRNDGYIYEECFVKKIDFAVGKILEDCERFVNTKVYPKSLGDYLIEKFGEFVKDSEIDSDLAYELLDWHIRFQIIDNSCLNLYKVSAKDWGKYSCFGKDGQKHFNIKNGYQSLIDLLTEKIPENKIKLNHPVTSITQNGNHIIIKCQFDRTIVCDNLILTPSIGVLKQNLISFEPDLPEEYRKCVRSYGFHGIGKIFLVFSEKWWKADGFQLVWKKGTVLPEEKRWLRSISGFDNVLNQASVLVGWIGGEGIETVEKMNEDSVGRECVDLLRKFLRNGDIPYPVKTIRTTWFSSPYIKGGYSHTTPSNDESNTGSSNLLKPIEVNGNSRIRFAGEAVHENHFSTTHGAFQSGEIAANELLKNIQKHKL